MIWGEIFWHMLAVLAVLDIRNNHTQLLFHTCQKGYLLPHSKECSICGLHTFLTTMCLKKAPKNGILERVPRNGISEGAPKNGVLEGTPRNGVPEGASKNGIRKGSLCCRGERHLSPTAHQRGLQRMSHLLCERDPRLLSRMADRGHVSLGRPLALWCSNHLSLCYELKS